MACARVCCILLGETKLLKWHVPVCAVFSQCGDEIAQMACARSVLYSPRGDEIAQMVCARVCCILLVDTRFLKWYMCHVCAVFSQGRRDCSNGMCPCVLYFPRGDKIAQMVGALVCCILLSETKLLKWYVPLCAVFFQGRRDCSNGMCPCVLYSPRGDEIASNGRCPCVLYSPRGDEICSNGRCPCVLYSPRGDEIAQMACARV